ncbi:MAG: TadE family protein [Pseudomonadota bacterium]
MGFFAALAGAIGAGSLARPRASDGSGSGRQIAARREDLRGGFKRRKRAQRGSAAVEFALVAPAFFAMTFAVLECGYFFFVDAVVNEAVKTAARTVRTGQAVRNSVTPQAFFNQICSIVDTFGPCNQRLTVDIETFADFQALANDLADPNAAIQCRNSGNPGLPGAQFNAADFGNPRSIVRVRVCFLHKPFNPLLGVDIPTNGDGFREMVAVEIFRNEPFDPTPPAP